jgi:hypothetical protein
MQAAEEIGLARAALLSAHEAYHFAVWPENWPAVQLFQAMATQWHTSGMGYRTGLVYASVPQVQAQLRQRGRLARDAFAGLQVLEARWLAREHQARAKAA